MYQKCNKKSFILYTFNINLTFFKGIKLYVLLYKQYETMLCTQATLKLTFFIFNFNININEKIESFRTLSAAKKQNLFSMLLK